jgi:hypothetical protein
MDEWAMEVQANLELRLPIVIVELALHLRNTERNEYDNE